MMYKRKNHAISGVFVFLLLGLFAVFGTVLVLLGSQAYRGIVDRTSVHNEARIMGAFVRHAVRAEDQAGAVSVAQLNGMPVLCISDQYDDQTYNTYIYVYENELRELYMDAEEAFEPERGETICEGAVTFDAQVNGRMLTTCITDLNGHEHRSSIVLYSGEVTP